MPSTNFRPQDLPDTVRAFLSSAVQLFEKLNLLDQDDPVLKLVGATLKATDMIHDPEQAARRGIGSAVALAFYGGLVRYEVPMYLNASQEGEFREALKEGIEKAPVDLNSLDLSNVFDSATAQHFIDIHFRYFKRARVDEGRGEEEKYEPKLRYYLKRRLKIYFLRLLDHQTNKYGILREKFSEESFLAEKKEIQFANYQQRLAEMYHEPTTFSENSIRLSQLYVEPHCEVLENICGVEYSDDRRDGNPLFKTNEDVGLPTGLHDLLGQWLDGTLDHQKLVYNRSNFLVLYGMPGQGKSSFCRRLLHDLLAKEHQRERPVFFLKLRDPYLQVDKIKTAPLPTIIAAINKQYDIQAEVDDLENAVLILDGMDELAMSHEMSLGDADGLLRDLHNVARRMPDIHLLITSRHGYLKAQQELQNSLVLQLADLTPEQQFSWLSKYRELRPASVLTKEYLWKMHKNSDAKIKDLITQPLLLNLIADLDFLPDETANRSKVYESIVDHIVDTPWKTEQLSTLNKISRYKSLFRDSLQEIGFKMFQRGQEYLPEDSVNSEGSITNIFLKKLGQEGVQDGVRTLYLSFYFRPVQEEINSGFGKSAIEFAHKSFQEYITAEYLYRQTKKRFTARSEHKGFILKDSQKALRNWTVLFGQRPLSKEIRDYFIETILNDPNEDGKLELQERLLYFAKVFFEEGFLDVLSIGRQLKYKKDSVLSLSLEAGYAWFLVVGILGANHLIHPDYSWREHAHLYLRQLLIEERNWQLRGAVLYGVNLCGANFRKADLRSADLFDSDFRGTDFFDANLSNADLSGSDLSGVSLVEASLRDSNLSGAQMRYSNLGDADLSNANLINADLNYADLSGADLSGANLTDAGLRGAEISGANLTDAILSWTDLSKANLSNVNFTNADLSKADLRFANLTDADLSGANLNGILGITKDDLINCESLYQCKNLSKEIKLPLTGLKPELFEPPL